MLTAHAIFFAVPHEAEEEMVDFLGKNHQLVYSSSLILRLCNDLGTLEVNNKKSYLDITFFLLLTSLTNKSINNNQYGALLTGRKRER